MAKRKTPKAEMPEKITHKELNYAQTLVETITKLHLQVGRLEVEKQAILSRSQEVQETIDRVQGEMLSKYGTNDIDLKTGKIKYNKINNAHDDQAD